MSTPERMKAIRRLFLAKLEKMPSDVEHPMRVEMARKELDKVLGPIWRHEVEMAGVDLDPTGDMSNDMTERLDKLPIATRDEGYHGDDVPEPEPKKKDEKNSIIKLLLNFLHRK